jgi:putative MATE family efflux protein
MNLLPPAELRREIGKIAIPVSLESVFQLSLGLINQVIVGTLGTATIAAVGLSNNLMFIGILCLNTLGSGAAILVARARGRGDATSMSHITSVSTLFSVLVSLAFSLPVSMWAKPFLQAVGASQEISDIGGPFLALIALTLPLITTSVVASAVFRSTGHARVPMVVTMTSMALTPVLSWIFVVHFGVGTIGAAIAGLLTQGLRAVSLLGFLFLSRWGLRFRWLSWSAAKGILSQISRLIWPLFTTELLFSGGSFVFALLCERLGTEALATFQIVHTLEGVVLMASIGLNNAGTILVSQAIGRRDATAVWQMSKGVWQVAVVASSLFGLLLALSGLLLPTLYPNTTTNVHQWGLWAIVLHAVFQPVRVSNMTFFGILASGGDTRFLLLSDIVTVFFVGLPLAYFWAFNIGWSVWGIFLGRLLGEELVRLSMFVWRYYQGRWCRLDTGYLCPTPAKVK